MRKSLATVLVATTLSAMPVATQDSASATPCDNSVHWSARKVSVRVFYKLNGADSVYNHGPTKVTLTVGYGKSHTEEVQHHWEAGASAGISWGVVGAQVEAKYGESYTDAATAESSFSLQVPVKPHYTAWIRADFYQRVIKLTGKNERWNESLKRCVSQTVAVADWRDPNRQWVVVQKYGRVYPGRTAVAARR